MVIHYTLVKSFDETAGRRTVWCREAQGFLEGNRGELGGIFQGRYLGMGGKVAFGEMTGAVGNKCLGWSSCL